MRSNYARRENHECTVFLCKNDFGSHVQAEGEPTHTHDMPARKTSPKTRKFLDMAPLAVEGWRRPEKAPYAVQYVCCDDIFSRSGVCWVLC